MIDLDRLYEEIKDEKRYSAKAKYEAMSANQVLIVLEAEGRVFAFNCVLRMMEDLGYKPKEKENG